MKSIELLESPCTKQLYDNGEFSVYVMEGSFHKEASFTFTNDLLGIFACLKGVMHSGTKTLTYRLQQQLVSFAFRHRCEKIVPAGTDLLCVFILFPLTSIENIINRMGGKVNIALERFTSCECTVAYSSKEILRALSVLYKELNDQYPGFEILADISLQEVIVHFLRLFNEDNSEQREGFVMTQIKAFLADNCHRRISVDEVAHFSGYSKSHLSRLFKEATGISIVQFTNQLRVERACRLIRTGDGSIEEIAYEVGFQNLNHFYKTFKKVTGSLPSTYREGLLPS